MKGFSNSLFLFMGFILFGCGAIIPSADDMKAEQLEYEKNKAEVLKSKGALYKENKEALLTKCNLISSLLFSEEVEDKEFPDTSYWHEDPISEINLERDDSPKDAANTTLVLRLSDGAVGGESYKIIKQILDCDSLNSELGCLNLTDSEINNLLNLKYLFIDEQMLMIKPTITNSTEFNMGYCISTIQCYDLESKELFYKFSYSATNNEQVQSSFGEVSEYHLQSDLMRNISQEKRRAISKHFWSEN